MRESLNQIRNVNCSTNTILGETECYFISEMMAFNSKDSIENANLLDLLNFNGIS
jgi:hypothetical protein